MRHSIKEIDSSELGLNRTPKSTLNTSNTYNTFATPAPRTRINPNPSDGVEYAIKGKVPETLKLSLQLDQHTSVDAPPHIHTRSSIEAQPHIALAAHSLLSLLTVRHPGLPNPEPEPEPEPELESVPNPEPEPKLCR